MRVTDLCCYMRSQQKKNLVERMRDRKHENYATISSHPMQHPAPSSSLTVRTQTDPPDAATSSVISGSGTTPDISGCSSNWKSSINSTQKKSTFVQGHAPASRNSTANLSKLKTSQSVRTLVDQRASIHQHEAKVKHSLKVSGSTSSLAIAVSGAKAVTTQMGKHRRKSSERFVTNEGPRKAIKDFNVFEMHGRKAPAQTQIGVSSLAKATSNLHARRQKTTKPGLQTTTTLQGKKKPSQTTTQKKKKTFDQACALPRTIEVEEVKSSVPFREKLSVSVYSMSSDAYPANGNTPCKLQFDVGPQLAPARSILSPTKGGISVATIDLTAPGGDRSGTSMSQQRSQLTMDESNQVLVSSMNSLNGGAAFQTMPQQAVCGILETQSSAGQGVNSTMMRGSANPQEDRSYQTLNISRPFPKNLVTQEEESIIEIQSPSTFHPEQPSASNSSSRREVGASVYTQSKADGGRSMADHRRCLTTELGLIKDLELRSFDAQKQSLAQAPKHTNIHLTTSKKMVKNNSSKQTGQGTMPKNLALSSLEIGKPYGSTVVPLRPHPQTTRHSTTSFGFASNSVPFTASKGSLAAKGNLGPTAKSGLPASQSTSNLAKMSLQPSTRQPLLKSQSALRSAKSGGKPSTCASDLSQSKQSFVQKAVSTQKLTNLAPKFNATKAMKHSSSQAKPFTKNPTNGPSIMSKQLRQSVCEVVHELPTPSQLFSADSSILVQSVPSTRTIDTSCASKALAKTKSVVESSQAAKRNTEKSQTKTSLTEYVSCSVTRLKDARQSSTRRKGSQPNQTHNYKTNRINVSSFNTSSSLKLLNQSSQVPKQSSLKKQHVLQKAPNASSFLEQANEKSLSPQKVGTKAKLKLHQGVVPFLIQPRPSLQQDQVQLQIDHTEEQGDDSKSATQIDNPENTNATLESLKHLNNIKKVPKRLIRASSCQGRAQKKDQQSSSLVRLKPQTKCSFQQLQIIRQKESSHEGSAGTAEIDRSGLFSKVDEVSKTYSSNQSGVPPFMPPPVRVQRQNSAAAARQINKVMTSVLPHAQAQPSQNSRQTTVQAGCKTASVYNNKVDARFSSKEKVLTSSIGKETPSQFDFSNGLPECLRSGGNQPFFAKDRDYDEQPEVTRPSRAGETSLNDFHMALANESSSDIQMQTARNYLTSSEAKETNQAHLHHDFLHDFIDEKKLESIGDREQVRASVLNAEFSPAREYETFSKQKPKQPKGQIYYQDQQHIAHGVQNSQQESSHDYYGGYKAAQSNDIALKSSALCSDRSHQLLQSSFLSTDPNQMSSQITALQREQASHDNQGVYPSTGGALTQIPLDASLFKKSDSTFAGQGLQSSRLHHHLKQSSGNMPSNLLHLSGASQSKLINTNFSQAQSSHRRVSGTSGEDPLWTLSDEELTARQTKDEHRGQDQSVAYAEEQIQLADFTALQQSNDKTKRHPFADSGIQQLALQENHSSSPGRELLLYAKDLASVENTSERPSIEQIVPTRYSQLLLDSQRQSSSRPDSHLPQSNRFHMMSPSHGSSSYLLRKKQILDEHLQAAPSNQPFANNNKKLSLPFERSISCQEAAQQEASTVRDDECEAVLAGRNLEESKEVTFTATPSSSYCAEERLPTVSVMDGFQVDQRQADQWLTNQDHLRPKVIEDDDDDEEEVSESNDSISLL